MWIDRAVKWLLPREDRFFDLLERGGESAKQSGAILAECCDADNGERAKIVGRMIEVEHRADIVIHDVHEALAATFVTPIDRADIYTLATSLENVTDAAKDVVLQFEVHAIEGTPGGVRELAALAREACAEVAEGVKLLRGLKDFDRVRQRCKAIGKLEHDGDQIFRAEVSKMFKDEKDAVRLLKCKELLEGLERVLDRCDDVANALETLVVKHA